MRLILVLAFVTAISGCAAFGPLVVVKSATVELPPAALAAMAP